MSRSAASHLGLFCLPMSHKRDARLKYVNEDPSNISQQGERCFSEGITPLGPTYYTYPQPPRARHEYDAKVHISPGINPNLKLRNGKRHEKTNNEVSEKKKKKKKKKKKNPTQTELYKNRRRPDAGNFEYRKYLGIVLFV